MPFAPPSDFQVVLVCQSVNTQQVDDHPVIIHHFCQADIIKTCGLSDYRPHNLSPQLPEEQCQNAGQQRHRHHLLVLFCGQPHYVFHVQEIDLFLLVKELMFWEFDPDNLFLMKSYSLWGLSSVLCLLLLHQMDFDSSHRAKNGKCVQ